MRATIKTKVSDSIIDDHTASKVYAMCEKIWNNNPKIRDGYAAWHLEKYGCLPDEQGGKVTRVAARAIR